MADLCSSDRALRKEPEAAVRDRELLELAALAANQERSAAGDLWSNARGWPWDPLHDDGDALRLAVKLHMTVRCYMGNTCAQVSVPGQLYADADETNHADPAAATRRAIVRAAAAIGSDLRKTASGCSHTARPDGAKE